MSNTFLKNAFSVALTGGIGSGKSVVAGMFAARGAAIIDTDRIAHQLTAAGGMALPAIRARFGTEFMHEGAMNRAKMREHVFSDPAAKKNLESILHPLIRSEAERAAAQAQGIYLMFVVPLLFESDAWKKRTSRILVVDCPEQLQLERVVARSLLPESGVRAIMATQVSRETRLAAANDVIVNDRDMAALVPQVERLHALYSALAQANKTKQL
jgi:dephospho-CoA kinase